MHRFAMLVAIAVFACARTGQTPVPVRAPERSDVVLPTTDELRRDLYVFASDSFRGRETGTPDEFRAARFIADRIASLGLEAAGDSGYFFRFPTGRRRTGAQTSSRVRLIGRDATLGHNVVAIVRGSDPELSRTYVAYGAHLDHIGIQRPEHGDSIANGADDDGSGSMLLLALARTFAQMEPRPKRSILFVWHGGEEKGMLGSGYFTENATVPRDSIVAQLNADMIGRNHPDSLFVVGPFAAPNGQSRALGRTVDSVNATLPRPFKFNRLYDSVQDPEQIYYRSDHYSYARYGIPIVFFFSGLHEDYHRVTDSPDKIDYDKLSRVGQLLFETGMSVANSAKRPR
jgi:hypothetical protein